MRVLVTRPEPDAARSAARLELLGHEPLVDPLLTIEPVPVQEFPAEPFMALVATSANAVRIGNGVPALTALRHLPLYAVGKATAEAARAAGFAAVISAEGDVAALVKLIRRELSAPATILYLAGENRTQDLAASLAPHGIAVTLLVLYRMRVAQELPAMTRDALQAGVIEAVLHFSPRSAATFVALAERAGLTEPVRRIPHFCLSPAVAVPLQAIGAPTTIAARPEETELLACLRG
jgi:uroporphyrinogen-III synthase